jgi:cytochrome P450
MAMHPSPTATTAAFDPSLFDPFAPDQLEDPYPLYTQARREQPVFYSPRLDMWIVTRYDDICAVVKQPQRFSSAEALEASSVLPDPVNAVIETGYLKFQSLVQTDPPDHARVRGVFGKVLTPQRVAALEPRIRELCNQLIDDFIQDGHADLITQFAFPLPGLVICDLLGVPREDMLRVKRGHEGRQALMSAHDSVEHMVAAAREYVSLQHYFIQHLEQRVAQPQDDLLTLLAPAEIGGTSPLTMQEAVCNAIDLFAAGHETTTDLIGNGLSLLLAHPEQMQALRDDPTLIPAAIEEMLRMEAPVRGMFRMTTDEVTLGDVRLPKGVKLLVLYGSGNRDERQFSNPDVFDIRRKDASKHLSFGKGIHFCIGSVLARLEGRVAFELLLQRLPGLRRNSERPAVRRPFLILRAYDHFPIAWDLAPAV